MKKPLIGLTATTFPPDPERIVYGMKHLHSVEEEAAAMVSKAGGLPLLLPNTYNEQDLKQMVEAMDGLIFSGGTDVAPATYGEKPINSKWAGDKERDEYEFKLLKFALEAKKPILGLCRGIQLINVYFKGTLFQDINTQKKGSLIHRDPKVYDGVYHSVSINKDSFVYDVYKKEKMMVNSVHHQAIKELGEGFRATVISEDGIIEAIEPINKDRGFLQAVQWHPEWANEKHPELEPGIKLLRAFLKAC